MDKTVIIKPLQKLFDADFARNRKKQLKASKILKDVLYNFDNLELKLCEQKKILNDFVHEKETLRNCLEQQKQINEERNNDLVQLQQQKKLLVKKLSVLNNQYLQITESDREKAFNKKLRLNIIKISTKTYIDDKASPHIIQGCTGGNTQKVLHPFQFDTKVIEKKDITEALWESSKKSSQYSEEWEKLFTV